MTAYSGRTRSPVSVRPDHPFRSDPITDFGRPDRPFRRTRSLISDGEGLETDRGSLSAPRQSLTRQLAYDEIKTHQLDRIEAIRSRTPDGVEQELWGILLTFNLVRLEMAAIAKEANVAPTQISFVAAMRYIRDEWAWCAVASPGSIPAKLRRMRDNIRQFVLPPRRPSRRFPRAVKIKMSNYAKKRRISGTRRPK